MKRHLTASKVGVGAREDDPEDREEKQESRDVGAQRARTPFAATRHVRASAIEREVTLTSVEQWTHTLVLTGELTHRSAHRLEVEIERLCAEGVTGITLDLRELKHIDSIGVAVIAFRSRLCKRRGHDFALIPGSPLMRRAFEQAGVEQLLEGGCDVPVRVRERIRPRPLALAQAPVEDREGCSRGGAGQQGHGRAAAIAAALNLGRRRRAQRCSARASASPYRT
jgi:anti-anti-sigma factor